MEKIKNTPQVRQTRLSNLYLSTSRHKIKHIVFSHTFYFFNDNGGKVSQYCIFALIKDHRRPTLRNAKDVATSQVQLASQMLTLACCCVWIKRLTGTQNVSKNKILGWLTPKLNTCWMMWLDTHTCTVNNTTCTVINPNYLDTKKIGLEEQYYQF